MHPCGVLVKGQILVAYMPEQSTFIINLKLLLVTGLSLSGQPASWGIFHSIWHRSSHIVKNWHFENELGVSN